MKTNSTSDRVLFHLKTRGPATAQDIAAAFAMTSMGAHKVLQGLLDTGLVAFTDIAGGRGRPKRTYALTAAGHGRFPDRHSDLTVELLDQVRTLFGEAGLDRLIAAREAEQMRRYHSAPDQTLEQQVHQLAEMRAREGYMARVERNAHGELLLIEDHCPICAAASSCQGFCRSELTIFRAVLGPDIEVSREEHLLTGGRRCTYRIRPALAVTA
ncbi:helix-turn-helix transcriptional regulator [Mariluticola halotolerans]|uniref:helix-turn-helix transcriptional regulator n=1 Tax=Mariluticola halotolerans TaxID=2909283 RepID=UPI0026E2E21E|nr:MarR family transcriptional regulator [Mariluticola halotolerans]UJQ93136.1 MarR family transcriptional regulator [Mariluticola halotolerans]